MDQILLTGITTDAIVGVYPSEKHTPQPVKVDIAMELDAREAASSERLKHTVDYACLYGEIRFLLEACRFTLLETAAEAVARWALAPTTPGLDRGQVGSVSVEISKTQALGGSATPTIRIARTRKDVQVEVEKRPFGEVDVIFESRHCGIYRLRIAAGRSIPTHVHRIMDESEMVLTPGTLLQGRPVRTGSARHWPKNFPHRYDNPTARDQVVLCIDRPPFIPSDEIVVDEPAAGLEEVESKDYYESDFYNP